MKALVNFLLLIIVFGGGFGLSKSCTKPPKPLPAQYITQDDSVNHYKDLWNTEHAFATMEINKYDALYAEHTHMIDSLKKRLHLRDKQLQDMSQVISQATSRVETVLYPEYVHDTVNGVIVDHKAQSFTWNDQYTSISGVVDGGKVSVDYDVEMSFTATKYWHRKHNWFGISWGKKQYFIDVYSDNPHVHISGLKGFKVN